MYLYQYTCTCTSIPVPYSPSHFPCSYHLFSHLREFLPVRTPPQTGNLIKVLPTCNIQQPCSIPDPVPTHTHTHTHPTTPGRVIFGIHSTTELAADRPLGVFFGPPVVPATRKPNGNMCKIRCQLINSEYLMICECFLGQRPLKCTLVST